MRQITQGDIIVIRQVGVAELPECVCELFLK